METRKVAVLSSRQLWSGQCGAGTGSAAQGMAGIGARMGTDGIRACLGLGHGWDQGTVLGTAGIGAQLAWGLQLSLPLAPQKGIHAQQRCRARCQPRAVPWLQGKH